MDEDTVYYPWNKSEKVSNLTNSRLLSYYDKLEAKQEKTEQVIHNLKVLSKEINNRNI